MLYPAMKDLLDRVPSRYELVNVVAHKAREISRKAELEGSPLEEKPVSMAIREVAEMEIPKPEPEPVEDPDPLA